MFINRHLPVGNHHRNIYDVLFQLHTHFESTILEFLHYSHTKNLLECSCMCLNTFATIYRATHSLPVRHRNSLDSVSVFVSSSIVIFVSDRKRLFSVFFFFIKTSNRIRKYENKCDLFIPFDKNAGKLFENY